MSRTSLAPDALVSGLATLVIANCNIVAYENIYIILKLNVYVRIYIESNYW